MSSKKPTVAFLTAGAAGMFCGSCMRDNTLAAALHKLDCDVQLIPTYTPIRTDEENVSQEQVFYGGINVYLQQKSAFFRRLPRFMDRWLDQPWLINRLAARSLEVDAKFLGEMTVSILAGEDGKQRKETARLVDWLKNHVRPDLINLSNILIGGCIPALKRELGVPILVTLQGDDLFLADLQEPYRSQALAHIRRIGESVDGFIVFSRYYADFMAGYLSLPREKFQIVPMGVHLADFVDAGDSHDHSRPPTVGYLARMCPAKGLHVLVDAFEKLRQMPGTEDAKLLMAGWLGAGDKKYVEEQHEKLRKAGLAEHATYEGVIERVEKVDFLRSVDVLSVPTTYREPKGIYVLEALASGVPVVQPDHGAFPEILDATGGGRLFRPNDPAHLAETLHSVLTDHDARRALGRQGRASVHRDFSADNMARRTLEVYRRYLKS